MDAKQAEALRKPFDRAQIGKLPKGGVMLDYVGHAATTDRLLQVDPMWSWEPFATDANGLPAMDQAGNLWIRLTVAGVTRIGVGDGKTMKERIGDAIRNAAMRFGVALDLWAKEDLTPTEPEPARQAPQSPPPLAQARARAWTAVHALYPQWTDEDCKSETVDELKKLGANPASATVDQWNAVAAVWEGSLK